MLLNTDDLVAFFKAYDELDDWGSITVTKVNGEFKFKAEAKKDISFPNEKASGRVKTDFGNDDGIDEVACDDTNRDEDDRSYNDAPAHTTKSSTTTSAYGTRARTRAFVKNEMKAQESESDGSSFDVDDSFETDNNMTQDMMDLLKLSEDWSFYGVHLQ